MASIFDDTESTFHVVRNDEFQYSIWPDHMDIPDGWQRVGKSGKKQECLDYITEVWTDMRPRSLQLEMDGAESDRVAT